jgi:hypothetical protein
VAEAHLPPIMFISFSFLLLYAFSLGEGRNTLNEYRTF